MTTTLGADPAFRRNVLVAAAVVALLELAALGFVWRLSHRVDLADRRAVARFVMLGTVVTLQAMAVFGVSWIAVAISRTRLHHDVTGLTLDHPWRQWRGDWPDIRRAWQQNGWLVLQVREEWRRWYVRAAGHPDALAAVRGQLSAGVWLEGPALRQHLARTTLPIVVAVTFVLLLLLMAGLKVADAMRAP